MVLENVPSKTHRKPSSPEPFRELPGRVAQDAAGHGVLWPTTVEHYPGCPRLATERGTRAVLVLTVL